MTKQPASPQPRCRCSIIARDLDATDVAILRDLDHLCPESMLQSVRHWALECTPDAFAAGEGAELPLGDGRWTTRTHRDWGTWPLPIPESPLMVMIALRQWVEVSERSKWAQTLAKEPAWSRTIAEAARVADMLRGHQRPITMGRCQELLRRFGLPSNPSMARYLLHHVAPTDKEPTPMNGALLTSIGLADYTSEGLPDGDLVFSLSGPAPWMSKELDDRQRQLRQLHTELWQRAMRRERHRPSLRAANGTARETDLINELLVQASAAGMDKSEAADYTEQELLRRGQWPPDPSERRKRRNAIKQRYRRQYG